MLRWLETVSWPGVASEAVEHQHLLRAMDALVALQETVEQVLCGLLPLVDQNMTTIRTEGLAVDGLASSRSLHP